MTNDKKKKIVVKKELDAEKKYLSEIRDEHMPALTLQETKTYIMWNPPSAYTCCRGICRSGCRYEAKEEDMCDCCTGMCRCCAGVCGHN